MIALGEEVSVAPAIGVVLTSELALADPVDPTAMKSRNAPTRVLRSLTMLQPLRSASKYFSIRLYRLTSLDFSLLPPDSSGGDTTVRKDA